MSKIKDLILSSIIDDLLGEYILVSKEFNPNVMIMYKDKKVINSNNIENFTKTVEGLAKHTNSLDTDFVKYVLKNPEKVLDVVFTKDGLIRFSFLPKGEEDESKGITG